MTIEKRASDYFHELLNNKKDISHAIDANKAYIKGATEQNNVALEAFCKVCGYKKCAERDVRCTEYKEFEKLIKS